MSLSSSVVDSLKEAEACLRNALFHASRQERPTVCTQISRLLVDINNIQSYDDVLDRLDNIKSEK